MACARVPGRSARYAVPVLVLLAAPVLYAQGIGRDSARVARDSMPDDPRLSLISGAALISAPAFTLEQSLQGKVAGMVVSMNGGAPWSDGQIQIRGVSTLFGDPSPLVIVDGVRTTNTLLGDPTGTLSADTTRGRVSTARLRDFTPFEIESVEVLKGPAATSLYGSRGAAGVILITTRRGNDGPLSWRAIQRVGASQATSATAPRCFTDVVTAGLDAPLFGLNAPAAAAANGGRLPCNARAKQYFGNTGLGVESAVAVSGNVLGSKVMLSAARLSNGGPVDATAASRSNLRLNIDRALTSRLAARLSTGYALTKAEQGYRTEEATSRYQYFPSWLSDSAILVVPFENPLQWLRDGSATEKSWRSTSSIRLDYAVLRRRLSVLTVSYLAGLDRLSIRDRARLFVREAPPYDLIDSTNTNSTIDNHELSIRLSQQLGALGSFTVGGTVTRDRQKMVHYRGRFIGGFQSTSREADFELSTSGLQLQSAVVLFDERLQLGASARLERFDGAAKTATITYPAVHAEYRVLGGSNAAALTLRSAWGQSGGLGALGTAPLIAVRPDGVFSRTPNNRLTEKRTDIEFGGDYRSRTGRMTVSGTLFRSRLDALWLNGTVPRADGFSDALLPDIAAMRTTGAELTVAARVVESRQFRWDSRINVSRSATRLTRPREAAFFQRIYPRHSSSRWHSLLGGEAVTAISAGNGRVNGDAAPRFDLSSLNSVSRGPLSVSLQVDWRSGGHVYSTLLEALDLRRTSSDYDAPSPAAGTGLGAYRRAQAIVGDTAGAYLSSGGSVRLREVTVRYALSPRWAARGFASRNVGVSAQARNLAMWTNSIASDPEFSGLGTNPVARYVDRGGVPPMRQMFLGIDVGF